jgi:hypothetical protein
MWYVFNTFRVASDTAFVLVVLHFLFAFVHTERKRHIAVHLTHVTRHPRCLGEHILLHVFVPYLVVGHPTHDHSSTSGNTLSWPLGLLSSLVPSSSAVEARVLGEFSHSHASPDSSESLWKSHRLFLRFYLTAAFQCTYLHLYTCIIRHDSNITDISLSKPARERSSNLQRCILFIQIYMCDCNIKITLRSTSALHLQTLTSFSSFRSDDRCCMLRTFLRSLY